MHLKKKTKEIVIKKKFGENSYAVFNLFNNK